MLIQDGNCYYYSRDCYSIVDFEYIYSVLLSNLTLKIGEYNYGSKYGLWASGHNKVGWSTVKLGDNKDELIYPVNFHFRYIILFEMMRHVILYDTSQAAQNVKNRYKDALGLGWHSKVISPPVCFRNIVYIGSYPFDYIEKPKKDLVLNYLFRNKPFSISDLNRKKTVRERTLVFPDVYFEDLSWTFMLSPYVVNDFVSNNIKRRENTDYGAYNFNSFLNDNNVNFSTLLNLIGPGGVNPFIHVKCSMLTLSEKMQCWALAESIVDDYKHNYTNKDDYSKIEHIRNMIHNVRSLGKIKTLYLIYLIQYDAPKYALQLFKLALRDGLLQIYKQKNRRG